MIELQDVKIQEKLSEELEPYDEPVEAKIIEEVKEKAESQVKTIKKEEDEKKAYQFQQYVVLSRVFFIWIIQVGLATILIYDWDQ